MQLLRTAGTYNHTLQAPERDLLECVHQKIRGTPELHQHDSHERRILNTIGQHLETGWSVGEIRRFLGKKAYILDTLQQTIATTTADEAAPQDTANQ